MTDVPNWIAERIRAEYRKFKGTDIDWALMAAVKIWTTIKEAHKDSEQSNNMSEREYQELIRERDNQKEAIDDG